MSKAGIALLAVLLLQPWAPLPARAQEPAGPAASGEPATAIRAFLAQRDRLVVEQIDPLAPVPLADGGSLAIAATWAFEPGHEQRRLLGVRVELAAPGATGPAPVFYLDLHEVEELIRAMALMEEAVRGPKPSEARFVTLEGFGVIAQADAGGRPAFAVSGHGSATLHASLDRDAFFLLRARLQEARERLFAS